MIIGLCGRLRSGKSELSKVCEKCGYERLYFALPLKHLCADILNISIEELNKCKNNRTEIGITIGEDICEILHNETEIPIEIVKEVCLGKTIKDVRHMLQFIGTDLIRKYNEDWHVDRLRRMLVDGKNYVFDDVRFPNEKKMIEDLGGDCWFVVRPTINNISNHESETSITWHNCYNKIIINDSTLPYLLFKWEAFMDNYDKSRRLRDEQFDRILENGIEDIEKNSISDILLIHKAMFTYVPKEYDKNNIKRFSMNEDKSMFVIFNDDSRELIENPLLIEDLKMLM